MPEGTPATTPPATVATTPPAATAGATPPPATAGDMATALTNWKDLLPADLKSSEFITNTKTITDLASQAVNAQKLIGNRIPVPKDDADDTAWGEVYKKLGRPDDATGYQVERPENATDIGYTDEREKAFLATAHKIGLNTKQANALIKWQSEVLGLEADARADAMENTETQLRKEWGGKYDERMATVQRVIGKYDEMFPGLLGVIDTSGIGNDPTFIKFCENVLAGLAEGRAPGGEGGSAAMTPQRATVEIDRLMADKEFSKSYYTGRDENHRKAVDAIMALRQLIAAG